MLECYGRSPDPRNASVLHCNTSVLAELGRFGKALKYNCPA